MTTPATGQTQVKFYLVGRVPVRLEELASGGVDVLAFNPLLGGYVHDARYYSAVLFEDMGRVREIDGASFETAVQALQQEFEQTA